MQGRAPTWITYAFLTPGSQSSIAWPIAVGTHRHERDRRNERFILHPIGDATLALHEFQRNGVIAQRLRRLGYTEDDEVAIYLLHDVIESRYKKYRKQLRQKFGPLMPHDTQEMQENFIRRNLNGFRAAGIAERNLEVIGRMTFLSRPGISRYQMVCDQADRLLTSEAAVLHKPIDWQHNLDDDRVYPYLDARDTVNHWWKYNAMLDRMTQGVQHAGERLAEVPDGALKLPELSDRMWQLPGVVEIAERRWPMNIAPKDSPGLMKILARFPRERLDFAGRAENEPLFPPGVDPRQKRKRFRLRSRERRPKTGVKYHELVEIRREDGSVVRTPTKRTVTPLVVTLAERPVKPPKFTPPDVDMNAVAGIMDAHTFTAAEPGAPELDDAQRAVSEVGSTNEANEGPDDEEPPEPDGMTPGAPKPTRPPAGGPAAQPSPPPQRVSADDASGQESHAQPANRRKMPTSAQRMKLEAAPPSEAFAGRRKGEAPRAAVMGGYSSPTPTEVDDVELGARAPGTFGVVAAPDDTTSDLTRPDGRVPDGVAPAKQHDLTLR